MARAAVLYHRRRGETRTEPRPARRGPGNLHALRLPLRALRARVEQLPARARALLAAVSRRQDRFRFRGGANRLRALRTGARILRNRRGVLRWCVGFGPSESPRLPALGPLHVAQRSEEHTSE